MRLLFALFIALVFCVGSSVCSPRSSYAQAPKVSDEQLGNSAQNLHVEQLLSELNDPNYRKRREAFLALCDRNLDINNWLASESKSDDRYRSAVAQWLVRLRQSSGSPMERLETLQDLESLKEADERVLQRYIGQGKWDQLIELCSLLDTYTRRELFSQENRVEWIVEQAWKSNQESYVPKLLNLTLSPTDRFHANQWWRKLGFPEEWRLDEATRLPSVQILALEAEGKVDEAIDVAKKKGGLNYVEGLLLRAGRWDEWMALDTRRIPITVGLQNFHHQKIGILISLGRFHDANELFDKTRQIRGAPGLVVGDALFALALGRDEDYQDYLKSLPMSSAFSILRARGEVERALSLVGLEDPSTESVDQWLKNRAFEKITLPDDDAITPELMVIDIADLLFQIGSAEQGALLDAHVISKAQAQEVVKGAAAWPAILRQWRARNDRDKAVKQWTAFLIRDKQRARSQRWYSKLEADDASSPWGILYPDFAQIASEIFEFACRIKLEGPQGSAAESDHASPAVSVESTISLAMQDVEDLFLGRMPRGWKESNRLEGLRQALIAQSKNGGVSLYSISLELADLMESLGESKMALEVLELLPVDKNANLARAKNLKRLGDYHSASSVLLEEFAQNSTDLPLMLECSDCLELAGKFSELDRVRIQGLSSVANTRIDVSERSLFSLPPRREVQLVLEQYLARTSDLYSLLCLAQQYGEEAKKDLSQSKVAARYARLDLLERIKNAWSNEKFALAARQFFFLHPFTSFTLEAIEKGDRDTASALVEMVHRCAPQDIDFPIAVIPVAEKAFGKEVADSWFELYFRPMLSHAERYPSDNLIGNNTAWLAASCGRELETALKLATRVVASDPNPTYLDTLAEIQYRLGQVDKAIELSEQCHRREPKEIHHREQLKRFRAGEP
jgi:hypothetical protein